MKKAVFVDIDDVIYRGTIGVDFARYLYGQKILEESGLIEMRDRYGRFKGDQIDFLELLIFIWAGCIKGKSRITIEKCARVFIEENKDNINSGMVSRIENHKKECMIVSVSASPIEVVSELGRTLNFDHNIATEVKDVNGIYTGEVVEPLLVGNGKVEAINALAKKYQIDLHSSYSYGDSISDLEMLQIVGNPVVVNPKYDLKTIAERRRWEILEVK